MSPFLPFVAPGPIATGLIAALVSKRNKARNALIWYGLGVGAVFVTRPTLERLLEEPAQKAPGETVKRTEYVTAPKTEPLFLDPGLTPLVSLQN